MDSDGELQGRLLKNSEHHEAHAISATTADRLIERISQLTMSDPTQISHMTDSDSNSDSASSLYSHPSSLYDGSSPFSFGLRNTAAYYQALLQDSTSPVRRIPLTGAQEGLVLTITSQDHIVHWSGSISEDGNTGLVDAMIILPYQEEDSIHNAKPSTEILNNFDSTEIGTNDGAICTREVFMVRHSQSPLIPLEQPDVRSSDEFESNISSDA
jgi:hypothetical protein